MRASFVFEKFTEDSDPIHDMGIGSEELYKRVKHNISKTSSSDNNDILNYCLTSVRDVDIAKTVITYIIRKKLFDWNDERAWVFPVIRLSNLHDKQSRAFDLLNFILDLGYKVKEREVKRIKEYMISYSQSVRTKDRAVFCKKIYDIIEQNVYSTRNEPVLQYFLKEAIKKNDNSTVKKILNMGIDPTYNNHYLLQMAIRRKNKEVVELLLTHLQKDPKYK